MVIALFRDGLIDKFERDREQSYLDNVAASFESQEYTITRAEQKVETIKAKSKVWLGFALISAWGFTNFNFQTSEKFELVESLSWSLPLLIILFAFVLYQATKKYYSLMSDAQFLKTLYDLKGSHTLMKVTLSVVAMVLLIWSWWAS